MARAGVLLYGVLAYAVFFVTFLYMIAFVGDFPVPKTVDSTARGWVWTLTADPVRALVVDLLLLGLFAVQHSVMARPGFKRWVGRFLPDLAERSTYVLASSIALIVLFAFWQPLPGMIWSVESALGSSVLWALFAAGWLLVLVATFLIDHFELFGLRQVWCHLRGRAFKPPAFQTPGPYRIVRHPMMLGFLVALWAIPQMSTGHLLFTSAMTGYIFLGLVLEERELARAFGETYRDYQSRVPMVVPALRWIRGAGRG